MTLNRDFITGAVVLCLGIVLFCLTYSINELTVSGVGAEFMPRLVAVMFGILGIIMMGLGMGKSKTGAAGAEKKDDRAPNGYRLVTLNILLFFLYLYALEDVGFLLTTPVYLFLQMWLLSAPDEVRFGRFAVVSILTSVGSYYLFLKAFQVILPAGILG